MSGVNAAATLTLEVNTGSAEEKLNALEQRINKLDGTHEVKIKLSGGDASQATKVYEQASRQISDYAKSHPITIAPFKMEQQGDIFGGLRTKLATELEATKKSFEAQIKSLNEQLAVLTAKGAGEAAKGLKIGLNAVGGSASSVFKLDEGQISKLNERMKQVGIESSTALEKGLTKTNFAAFNKVLGDLSKGTEASLQKVIDVTKEAQLMVTQLGGKQTALDTYGSYIVSGAAGTEASRRLTGLRSASAVMADWKDEEATAKMELAEAKKVEALRAQVTQTIIAGALAEAARREDIQSRWDKRKATRSMASAAAIAAEWKDEEATAKMELAEAKKITAIKEQTDTEFAKWAKLDIKQKAKATVEAARVYYSNGDPSLLKGTAAGLPQALASAQQLGSLQAAEHAVNSLSTAHTTAAKASVAHEEKIRGLPKHMWEAHSAARGLAGGLNALWLTYGATVPLMAGAALSGGFVAAAKAGSEFAYQLTFVKALGEDSAAAIDRLGVATLAVSKNSLQGPIEAANGLRILAQAGLDANQSLIALPTTLNLATVGEMKMEQAATTLVGVMNAFGLGIGSITHVGDVFAKAAALSQTSVQGMTEAMKTASVVGEQYGASMEDTATAITLLAKVNITGTAAGTALRNMLKEIYAPTKGASDVFKMLGVSASDSLGNLKSFPDVIFELQGKLAQFDKGSQVNILQKLFGERGAKEAIAMLSQTREEWDKLRGSISDSDGFIGSVASQLEMSVKGRFQQAINTMQVNLIKAFDGSNAAVQKFVDALASLADSGAFTTAINSIVSAVSTLGTALVNTTPLLIAFGGAWVAMKGATLAVAGLVAARTALAGLSAATGTVVALMEVGALKTLGFASAMRAAGGAAAVAGSTGVASLATGLAALAGPTGWIALGVAGFTALAFGISKLVPDADPAIAKMEELGAAIKRQADKVWDEVEALKKRRELLNGGEESDIGISKVQRELDKNKQALSRLNAQIVDAPDWGVFTKSATALAGEAITLQNQIKAGEADLERGLAGQRAKASEGFKILLDEMAIDAAKIEKNAAKQGKSAGTEYIRAFIKSFDGVDITDGAQLRALQEHGKDLIGDARQGLMGSGSKKYVPTDDKPNRGAQKDARTIFDDNLSTAIAKNKLETDLKTLEIDRKVADQTIDSISAIREKTQAQKEGLEAQKATLEAALRDIDVTKEQQALLQAAKDEGSGQFEAKVKELKLDDKKVQITKVLNDLSQLSVEQQKQGAQASVTLAGALRNQANAIEDISKASARYSEDLKDEISYLGKTTLEVQQLRIEKQRLRDVQDIDTKLKRNTISAPEAEALKAQAEAKAQLDDAEAQRQLSFVGGWQKAYDENLKNITDMSKRAGDIFNKMSDGMADSLTEFVTTGKISFGDLVNSMIKDMIRMQMKAMTTNLLGLLGNSLGFGSSSPTGLASLPSSVNAVFPNANGGVYQSPSLHSYANQIHDTPKFFAFAQGGVFGEAGPEAIMPLKRGPDGKLGVQASGSGSSGSGLQNLRVEIVNQGSNKQQVTDVQPRFDAKGMIVAVVLDDLRTNGPVSQGMTSRFGLRGAM